MNHNDILSLSENPITSSGARILFETLIKFKSLISLINIRDTLVDDDCMMSLGELLQNNDTIQTLVIGGGKNVLCKDIITDKGIENLAPYLQGNISLEYLDFSGFKGITDKSISYFMEIIENSNIEFIYLHETDAINQKLLLAPLAKNILRKGLSDNIDFYSL